MKKMMKKFLAFLLVSVMVFDSLSALGPAVVKAADVDNTLLKVKVVNEEGNPVENVELLMESQDYPSYANFKIGPTNADGEVAHQLEWEMDGTFELKPADDSGFTCEAPVEIDLDVNSDWKAFVDTVNGEAYTGEIVLTVSGEAIVKPVITSVTATKTSVSKEGETLTLTVNGENLPDTLYYTRHYNIVDEYGPFTYNVEYNGVEVAAEGTETEKTIEVPIPAASGTYAQALSWKVKVGLSADECKVVTSDIVIDGAEVPKTPEIKEVLTKDTVSADGETVTVTVNGENLPDTLYYNVFYTCEEFPAESSVHYPAKSIALTGTDTEKTFEVAIPATSEFVEKVTSWKVGVCTIQYGSFVKSATIAIQEGEEPDVPVDPEEPVEPEEPEVPAEPVLTTVTAAKTSVSKDGETIAVTVKGENLPETLYYKRQYVGDDGFGGTMDMTVDWSGIAVEAIGTATEKTINVPLPGVSAYADATAWKISVSTDVYGTYKKTSAITIEGLEESSEPEITAVATSKDVVSSEGETITVTVTGKNLPETVYCRLYSQYEISGKLVDTAYGVASMVNLTGTDANEKTFEVAIPAESEVDGGTPGWKVAVSLSMNGSYVKSSAMTVQIPEEPDQPAFDNKVLNVKTVDKDGNPVAGVTLVMESEYVGQDVNIGTTDAEGKLSHTLEYEVDTYYLKPVENTGYICAEPAEIYVGEDDDWNIIVETVNGEPYTGEVVLVVEEPEVPAEPVLTAVTAAKTSVSKDGETIAVTVKGENLPETLYYKRQYVGDDGFGGTMDKTVDWSGVEVEATGTATEKTINVPLPGVSAYADATAWKISVAADAYGTYKKTSAITIEGLEEPAEPEITAVTTSKDAVSSEGETITVTVTGKNLPETVYCRLYSQYEISGKLVDTAYGVASMVNLTGTDANEKTFEVAIPAESEVDGGTPGWKVAVSLSMNGSYVKSSAMTVQVSELPEVDKSELLSKLEELMLITRGNYTLNSFKALQSAINEATIVFNNDEATEEDVADAIVLLNEANAALKEVTGMRTVVIPVKDKAGNAVAANTEFVKSNDLGETSVYVNENGNLEWTPEEGVDKGVYEFKLPQNSGYIALPEVIAVEVSEEDGTPVIAKVNGVLAAESTAQFVLVNKKADLPKAPSTVKAVLSGAHNNVKISWSKSAKANGYHVYFKKATANTWIKAVSTTALSYTKKNLAVNVKYNFKVVPYINVNGQKVYDEAQYKTVTITTKKNVKAPATMKVNLSGGYDDVKISWSKVSGAAGYYVSMKKAGATTFTRIATTTNLSFVKKNLADGVKYTFQVAPYYKNGTTKVRGFYSKTAAVTTLKKIAVPKVTKVSAKKVKVSWTNIQGETGYQISRAAKKAGTNIVSTYKTTTGKTKTLNVTKGKKYYYKVRAYKTVNGKKIFGPWSNVKAYTLK